MRLKVLACETLFREVYGAMAESPHVCDVKFLPRDCHDDLDLMRRWIQEEIDLTGAAERPYCDPGVRCPACTTRPYDALVLAMGLCGNTTQGVRAGRVPLVLPCVHDCHGLLLGGNARYLAEEKGTVFYHQGAVERLGAEHVDAVPCRFGLGRTLDEYIRAYGEDNGRYIFETEYGFARYNHRALFLYHEDLSDVARKCRREVEAQAARFGWEVACVPIDMDPFRRLLAGRWEDGFLVVPAGETVRLEVTTRGEIRSACGHRPETGAPGQDRSVFVDSWCRTSEGAGIGCRTAVREGPIRSRATVKSETARREES